MGFLIQSQGLSGYEQSLLKEQLRVVDKRMSQSWVYQGEGAEAQVIFSKQPVKTRAGQVLVLLKEPKEKFPQQVVEKDDLIILELPLRILGVMDVLKIAEARISQDAANEPELDILPLSLQLIRIKSKLPIGKTVKISLLEDVCLSAEESGCFFLTTYKEESLVQRFVDLGKSRAEISAEAASAPQNQSGYRKIPFAQLMWALGLAEKPSSEDVRKWRQRRVAIKRWPLFGVWKTDSRLMRLVALYTKDCLTIDVGVSGESVPEEDIIRLFRACELAGLKLEIREVKDASSRLSVTKKPPVKRSENGFLSLFRKTLGLAG